VNKSESITNLAGALSSFQGEVENPKNTANNPYFKSKYAPLNDVLNIVRPVLAKNGLSILQSPSGDGENIVVCTTLLHSSGEWIEFEPLILKADKATAQGAGSAITYARRYAVSAILGISSEDDDDGNHASDNKPQQPAQQPKPQQPKQQSKPQQPTVQQKPQQKATKPLPEPTEGDKELEITMADYANVQMPTTDLPRVLLDKPRKALHAIRNELGMNEVDFKRLISDTCLPQIAGEFGFSTFEVISLNDLAILDDLVLENLIRGLNTVAKQHKQSSLGQLVCENESCLSPISANVHKFSMSKFGKGLCMNCQKTAQQGAR
jgi:hypothetical protein